jgi:hypothetical protein
MKLEVSAFDTQNIFGYHDSAGNHVLFTGPNGAGATATFTPTGDYYFYLQSPDGTFSTNMTGGDAYQHFAIFKEADGIYWLGMEDLVSATTSDKDYNDMIVKVSQVPVPEPTTMLLLGLGLVGLAGIRRKFKS